MSTDANPDCLFCRLATDRETVIWQSETVAAFKDINPQAPIHILVVPKRHITSLADTTPEDKDLLGELLLAVAEVARQAKVEDEGYRVVINTREHGEQAVDHLHLHILGGEPIGPLRDQS